MDNKTDKPNTAGNQTFSGDRHSPTPLSSYRVTHFDSDQDGDTTHHEFDLWHHKDHVGRVWLSHPKDKPHEAALSSHELHNNGYHWSKHGQSLADHAAAQAKDMLAAGSKPLTQIKKSVITPSSLLDYHRKLAPYENLIKAKSPRMKFIVVNSRIAENEDGQFTPEEVALAHENLRLLNADYFPKHKIRDGLGAAPGDNKIDKEWAELNQGRAGKKVSGAGKEDFERLRGERTVVRRQPKQSNLVTAPRSEEEKKKAGLISAAKKIEKERAELDNQPLVAQRAKAQKEIIAGSHPQMAERSSIKNDPELTQMRAKLATLSDDDPEKDYLKAQITQKGNQMIPQWHPVYKNYNISEDDWNRMGLQEKMFNMANHYELAGMVQPHPSLRAVPPPDDFHEMLADYNKQPMDKDHAAELWHDMDAKDQRHTYNYIKNWRARKSTSAPTPETSEIKPGQLEQGQPSVTEPVKKSVNNLESLLIALRDTLRSI